MSLRSEVYNLLDNTQKLCAGVPGAKRLESEIQTMRERLDLPLRVAIVGIMKAGKSTFMNALMGAKVVSVGELETTYTVGWFKYAEKPGLTVCFRDGREQQAPFEELEKWSVRKSENEEIDDVKYLIIHYPSEVLKQLEFIDTPGLNSIYGTDSQNTLDFLSIRSSEETLKEASMADAVIYAFNRTLDDEKSVKFLQSFHAGSASNQSPLNSIGILTKADKVGGMSDWPDGSPIKYAETITRKNMENPQVNKLLYAILPVCAMALEGCDALNDADWAALQRLSELDQETLMDDYLVFASDFCENDEEDFMEIGSIEVRKHLMDSLQQFGILEIARRLREGKKPEEIKEILADRCGITAIKNLILSHFGNRTFIIKVEYIFNRIRAVVDELEKDNDTSFQMKSICTELKNHIDDIMSTQQKMRELKIIQMYYNGQIQFDTKAEEEDFLQITGEYGKSVEARLGVDGASTTLELEQIAKKKIEQWHYNAYGNYMKDAYYIEAASVIARSYEHLYFHLNALNED